MDVKRRTFLQVVGLSVACPSIFTEKTEASPKPQNPDTITTGFESIDDALEGGWRKGTLNVIYGREGVGRSLVLQSMAIKAATDLSRPATVCLITKRRKGFSKERTPFDGCMTIIEDNKQSLSPFYMLTKEVALNRSAVFPNGRWQWDLDQCDMRLFDLIVFESREVFEEYDCHYLANIAHAFDCAIVAPIDANVDRDHTESVRIRTKTPAQIRQIRFANSTRTFFNSSVVLAYEDARHGPPGHSRRMIHTYKNRWGSDYPSIRFRRTSAHLVEEEHMVMNTNMESDHSFDSSIEHLKQFLYPQRNPQ